MSNPVWDAVERKITDARYYEADDEQRAEMGMRRRYPRTKPEPEPQPAVSAPEPSKPDDLAAYQEAVRAQARNIVAIINLNSAEHEVGLWSHTAKRATTLERIETDRASLVARGRELHADVQKHLRALVERHGVDETARMTEQTAKEVRERIQ